MTEDLNFVQKARRDKLDALVAAGVPPFAYGAPEGPRAFVSTIKLRQAGFTKTIDTEDSFRNALQSLIDHKLLPPAAK